mgnify:CR=1 FL=1
MKKEEIIINNRCAKTLDEIGTDGEGWVIPAIRWKSATKKIKIYVRCNCKTLTKSKKCIRKCKKVNETWNTEKKRTVRKKCRGYPVFITREVSEGQVLWGEDTAFLSRFHKGHTNCELCAQPVKNNNSLIPVEKIVNGINVGMVIGFDCAKSTLDVEFKLSGNYELIFAPINAEIEYDDIEISHGLMAPDD